MLRKLLSLAMIEKIERKLCTSQNINEILEEIEINNFFLFQFIFLVFYNSNFFLSYALCRSNREKYIKKIFRKRNLSIRKSFYLFNSSIHSTTFLNQTSNLIYKFYKITICSFKSIKSKNKENKAKESTHNLKKK